MISYSPALMSLAAECSSGCRGRGAVVSAARGPARAGADVRGDPVYRLKAELFRTLGHPARIRLLEVLGTGERTVGESAGGAGA